VVGAGPGGVSLYSGRRPGEGRECQIEDQLLSTPLEATRLALASDLSNVVVGFASYRQFYSVLWVDANGVQLRQRAVVTRPPGDADDAAPGGIVVSAVETLGATTRAFATDVTLGDTTVRLFDLEPVPISAAGAAQATAMQPPAAGSPCDLFARASADVIRFAADDKLLETVVSGKGGSVAYCLHLKDASYRSPKGIAPTLATLYRVRGSGELHAVESQTPLFSELVLGANRPEEVRIAAEVGWLAFRGGVGRRWRAIPWGLEAWRELAQDVFDAQRRPAAEGNFSLITGGEPVPDVPISVAQHGAGALPVKAFVEAR
jgi:hypothetical protein